MNDTASVTSSQYDTHMQNNNIMFYKKKAIKKLRNGKNIVINVNYKVFGTGLYGYIRNAVTGMPYLARAGSNDEHQYFKVISMIGDRAITLFYSSPAEYELHQQQIVSDVVKENWSKRKARTER